STGDLGELRREGRTALETVGTGFGGGTDEPSRPEPLTAVPAVGDAVFVTTLGTDAIVRAVTGHKIDVEFRGKRMRVLLGDLRRGASPAPEPPAPTRAASARTSASELILIGSTVDEALERAAKFLDDALLTDERRLRVVHGHGTGRLREALRAYFREHPLVASVTPAPDHEGGGGATIVELKD
ncbi:MAG TPA: Smr/MutS family protein, partial [Vicinamibacterales bacterium]